MYIWKFILGKCIYLESLVFNFVVCLDERMIYFFIFNWLEEKDRILDF